MTKHAPLPPPPPPPPAPSVRAFSKAKTGRPPKWNKLLTSFLKGSAVKEGPYKNRPTAIAAAGWFNGQMKAHAPREFGKGFRFRGKGLYVLIRKIDLNR